MIMTPAIAVVLVLLVDRNHIEAREKDRPVSGFYMISARFSFYCRAWTRLRDHSLLRSLLFSNRINQSIDSFVCERLLYFY